MSEAMHLKILLPSQIFIDQQVCKVIAEAENGSFCVRPRHIDFLASLKPGILSYIDLDGKEVFVGHDVGVFVKKEREVTVSTLRAVRNDDLKVLRNVLEEVFITLEHKEVAARTALARLETGIVRRFVELGKL